MYLSQISYQPQVMKSNNHVNFKGYVTPNLENFVRGFVKKNYKGDEHAAQQIAENILEKYRTIMSKQHPNVYLDIKHPELFETIHNLGVNDPKLRECAENFIAIGYKGLQISDKGVPILRDGEGAIRPNLYGLDKDGGFYGIKRYEIYDSILNAMDRLIRKNIRDGKNNSELINIMDNLTRFQYGAYTYEKTFPYTRVFYYYKENTVPRYKDMHGDAFMLTIKENTPKVENKNPGVENESQKVEHETLEVENKALRILSRVLAFLGITNNSEVVSDDKANEPVETTEAVSDNTVAEPEIVTEPENSPEVNSNSEANEPVVKTETVNIGNVAEPVAKTEAVSDKIATEPVIDDSNALIKPVDLSNYPKNLDELDGIPWAKTKLRKAIEYLRDFIVKSEFAENHGIGIDQGMLLYGQTPEDRYSIAAAFANEAKMPMYTLGKADFEQFENIEQKKEFIDKLLSELGNKKCAKALFVDDIGDSDLTHYLTDKIDKYLYDLNRTTGYGRETYLIPILSAEVNDSENPYKDYIQESCIYTGKDAKYCVLGPKQEADYAANPDWELNDSHKIGSNFELSMECGDEFSLKGNEIDRYLKYCVNHMDKPKKIEFIYNNGVFTLKSGKVIREYLKNPDVDALITKYGGLLGVVNAGCKIKLNDKTLDLKDIIANGERPSEIIFDFDNCEINRSVKNNRFYTPRSY